MLPIGGHAPRWFMYMQHVDPIEVSRPQPPVAS